MVARAARWRGFGSVALLALTVACGSAGPGEANWPPAGKKWFDRASTSYREGDIDDAQLAMENALRVLPNEPEVRVLAARIALAQLEHERVIQLLEGLDSSDARGLRGRALWYSGQLDQAADELERLVSDPEVRDAWAVDVAKLARRGAGRKPFQLSGARVAVSEMPQFNSTAMVVPVEVNGEPALGMIATATAEAVIDASRGGEPTWISLRFGEGASIEVSDVPALAKDLSGLSRQINAPIKVLLGINLLRRLHPTFDFTGSQFVVRNYEPPPPPHATTVPVHYVRGGGMLLRGAFGSDDQAKSGAFLVDTSLNVPLALDEGGWAKAGVSLASLKPVQNAAGLKQGVLPLFRLGAFEVPRVPGVYGAPIADFEKSLDIEIDGLVGSGLLAAFRVTLVEGGRSMWLEDIPPEAVSRPGPSRGPAPPLDGDAPPGPGPAGAAPGPRAPGAAPAPSLKPPSPPSGERAPAGPGAGGPGE